MLCDTAQGDYMIDLRWRNAAYLEDRCRRDGDGLSAALQRNASPLDRHANEHQLRLTRMTSV